MIEEKLKNGAKIMSFQATNLCDDTKENDKLKRSFTGLYPCSLDLLELYRIKPDGFYTKNNNAVQQRRKNKKNIPLLYTNLIISVDFEKDLWEYTTNEPGSYYNAKIDKIIPRKSRPKRKVKSNKKMREQLYTDGFSIGGVKYVFYKRSSSTARDGSALFIQENLHDHMMLWSHLDIEFSTQERIDLASLKAYESLTLSGVEDLLTIDPASILLIDDKESTFHAPASVTRLDDGMPTVTNENEFIHISNIWDGQSLIDESILPDDTKGMYQLRNRFFKCAAFSTKIQQYFQDRCKTNGKDYESAVVYDMFQRPMLMKDVKLITCPSSLKLLKIFDFVSNKETKLERRKDAYDYWLNNISHDFGICKREKGTVCGTARSLSYQMINSLDLSKDEINQLLQEEFEYIKLLKSEPSVFRWHCNLYDPSPSESFICHLTANCAKADKTKLYKGFLNDKTDDYKNQLYQGKIKLTDTDYSVIVGNPIEMLHSAYGDEITDSIHLGKYDVWCSRYADGKELAGFRNPHVCAGNVLLARNVWHDDFRYLNLTANIVIVNNYESDLQNRLQGSDQDGDTILLSSNPILVEKAKYAQWFKTPVKDISLPATPRLYNALESAAIDDVVANNAIGIIIDWSQILNSYYWDCRSKGATNDELQEIYNQVSILSSLSQLELDKPKKYYDEKTVKIKKSIRSLHGLQWRGEPLIKTEKVIPKKKNNQYDITSDMESKIKEWQKNVSNGTLDRKTYNEQVNYLLNENIEAKVKDVKPMFFSKIPDKDKNCKFEYFNCPMDYLIQCIDEAKKKLASKRSSNIPIKSILVKIDGNNDNRYQIPVLFGLVYEADRAIKQLWNEHLKPDKRAEREKEILNELSEQFEKKKINIETVNKIIYDLYGDKDKTYTYINSDGEKILVKASRCGLRMMGALWESNPELVSSCFKLCGGTEKIPNLVKCDDGNLNIWGEKYKIV